MRIYASIETLLTYCCSRFLAEYCYLSFSLFIKNYYFYLMKSRKDKKKWLK